MMMIPVKIQAGRRRRSVKAQAMTCAFGCADGGGRFPRRCKNRCGSPRPPSSLSSAPESLHNPHHIMGLLLIERWMGLFGLNPSPWHELRGGCEYTGRLKMFDSRLCITTRRVSRQLDQRKRQETNTDTNTQTRHTHLYTYTAIFQIANFHY